MGRYMGRCKIKKISQSNIIKFDPIKSARFIRLIKSSRINY